MAIWWLKEQLPLQDLKNILLDLKDKHLKCEDAYAKRCAELRESGDNDDELLGYIYPLMEFERKIKSLEKEIELLSVSRSKLDSELQRALQMCL